MSLQHKAMAMASHAATAAMLRHMDTSCVASTQCVVEFVEAVAAVWVVSQIQEGQPVAAQSPTSTSRLWVAVVVLALLAAGAVLRPALGPALERWKSRVSETCPHSDRGEGIEAA